MSQTADARVDVREIDGEPFPEIVAALEDLGETETLELLAPFEPVPLYGELDDRGFTHEIQNEGSSTGYRSSGSEDDRPERVRGNHEQAAAPN